MKKNRGVYHITSVHEPGVLFNMWRSCMCSVPAGPLCRAAAAASPSCLLRFSARARHARLDSHLSVDSAGAWSPRAAPCTPQLACRNWNWMPLERWKQEGGIMIRQPDLLVTADNLKTAWDMLCKKHSLTSAGPDKQKPESNPPVHPVIQNDVIMKYLLVPAPLILSRHEVTFKDTWVWTSSWVIHWNQHWACWWTSELWDEPLSHHYEEACRQTSKPTQQQVASQHPVIKESVELQ